GRLRTGLALTRLAQGRARLLFRRSPAFLVACHTSVSESSDLATLDPAALPSRCRPAQHVDFRYPDILRTRSLPHLFSRASAVWHERAQRPGACRRDYVVSGLTVFLHPRRSPCYSIPFAIRFAGSASQNRNRNHSLDPTEPSVQTCVGR